MSYASIARKLSKGDIIIIDGGTGTTILGGCCGANPQHIHALTVLSGERHERT